MAHSGITAGDELALEFNELKMQKKHRFLIYKVVGDNRIELDVKGPRNSSFEDFLQALPDRECRYAVYDYDYRVDTQDYSKICFILWSPDQAKTREKMLISSSKDALTKKLGDSIRCKFQASDKGDLDEEEVRRKCITGK